MFLAISLGPEALCNCIKTRKKHSKTKERLIMRSRMPFFAIYFYPEEPCDRDSAREATQYRPTL